MAYEILWRVHALLMTTSLLALLSGIVISLIFKKKKWRYNTHKRLGMYAGISGAAALLTALTMVQVFNGIHFTSLHGIFGGVTGLILILTPFMGLKIRKAGNKKAMKLFHKILGYTTAALMSATLLSGLLFVGILSFGVREPAAPAAGSGEPLSLSLSSGNQVVVSGVTFSWEQADDHLEVLLHAPVTGWISVGFNPVSMMEGADFIIGYVQDGEAFIRDEYGTGPVSHKPDAELGGADHIELLDFREDAQGTMLHFRIPLDSGDEYDHRFVPGDTIPVIFASSSQDSFTGIHQNRGKTDITF